MRTSKIDFLHLNQPPPYQVHDPLGTGKQAKSPDVTRTSKETKKSKNLVKSTTISKRSRSIISNVSDFYRNLNFRLSDPPTTSASTRPLKKDALALLKDTAQETSVTSNRKLPVGLWLASMLPSTVYNDLWDPTWATDPDLIFCFYCQQRHPLNYDECCRYADKLACIRDQGPSSSFAIPQRPSIRWQTLHVIMEAFRSACIQGPFLTSLLRHTPYWYGANILGGRIVEGRFILRFQNDYNFQRIFLQSSRKWVDTSIDRRDTLGRRIHCMHLENSRNLQRAHDLIEKEAEVWCGKDEYIDSSLFRCHHCPTEYMFFLKPTKLSEHVIEFRKTITYYIDFGECKTPIEREWLALTTPSTAQGGPPCSIQDSRGNTLKSIRSRFEDLSWESSSQSWKVVEGLSTSNLNTWQERIEQYR